MRRQSDECEIPYNLQDASLRALSSESEVVSETPPKSPLHVILATASSDGSSSASDDAQPSPSADLSPVEELYALIEWQGHGSTRRKRVRGPAETAHEKRVQAEQKRRGDLAQAIEEINELLPPTSSAGHSTEMVFNAKPSSVAKRTKIATVQEAAEYIRRVQDVRSSLTCYLISVFMCVYFTR